MTNRLIGRTIKSVRPMTVEEMESEGWDYWHGSRTPPVIVLDNGDTIYPSADDEGNGPGALFGKQDGKAVKYF